MKLSPEIIEQAVQALQILKFFPAGPGEQTEVMKLLDRIADSPDRLKWLVHVLLNCSRARISGGSIERA